MFIPKLYHLSGTDLWQHCDFENLQINANSQSIELATVEQVDSNVSPNDNIRKFNSESVLNDVFYELVERKGGATVMLYRPDRVDDSMVLLADPQQDLLQLWQGGWRSLLPKKQKIKRAETCFSGAAFNTSRQKLFSKPKTLAADPHGKLWLLEMGTNKIRALDLHDLKVLGTVIPPSCSQTSVWSLESAQPKPEVRISDLAVTQWGMVICDQTSHRLWQKNHAGEWQEITVKVFQTINEQQDSYTCIALSGHPQGDAVAIMRPVNSDQDTVVKNRSKLVYISQGKVRIIGINDFEDPLYLLLSDRNRLFVAEAGSDSERPSIHHFTSYLIDLDVETDTSEIPFQKEFDWMLRYFDGRALFVGKENKVWGTTTNGIYPLSRANTKRVTQGRVETYALDSQKIACQWHRVFIDACVPVDTKIEVAARVSDAVPDSRIPREPPRQAYGINNLSENSENAVQTAWQNLPLGSSNRNDTRDWISLGVLDKRPFQADIPLTPYGRQLPSDDEYHHQRSQYSLAEVIGDNQETLNTFEGLIKNQKGRYLWLRITLKGDSKYSPSIKAIRASFNRPSLLDHLPAYWRAEQQATRETDRVLSLFEGQYTELVQSVLQFKQLLDPRICPAEALPWLAKFIHLGFDTRLTEPVRRQLLKEMTLLYKQRGTMKGLVRLCEILTGRRIAVVEGFRLRRRSITVLGQAPLGSNPSTGSILGEGLQLGGPEPVTQFITYPVQEKWEQELVIAHQELKEELKNKDCPREEIPEPIPKDPALAFYRRFAHRFHVVIFGPKNDEIEAVIEESIEANKPAHTIHDVCWLEHGIRVGKNTYIGLGTVVADTNLPHPAILGFQQLGAHTLSRKQETCNATSDMIHIGITPLGTSQRDTASRGTYL